jgi:hypothetical protein
MSSQGRTLYAAVVALLIAVGLVAAPGAVAHAKPAPDAPAVGTLASCVLTSCNGLDPQAAGCSAGAYNLYEYTMSGYRVEHRYSPTCRATWTRASYVSGNAWSFRAYHESKVGTGTIQQAVMFNGNSGWSRMYSFSAWSRSCAVSNTSSHCGDYV